MCRAEARAKAADIEAIETDNAKKVEEEAAAGGIRKGETPQQYVARTVELDLGDF
jgi:RNA polymerase-associated protein RTF1